MSLTRSIALCVFLLGVIPRGFSQDRQTHVVDGSIVYQHVFEGELTNPLEFLENIKGVTNVRSLDGAMFGSVRVVQSDIKRSMTSLGMTWGKTPIFLQASDVVCQVQLEKREGRYRITLTDIVLHYIDPIYGPPEPPGAYVIKKNGTLRTKLFETTKNLYDEVFTNLFSAKNELNNDDW